MASSILAGALLSTAPTWGATPAGVCDTAGLEAKLAPFLLKDEEIEQRCELSKKAKVDQTTDSDGNATSLCESGYKRRRDSSQAILDQEKKTCDALAQSSCDSATNQTACLQAMQAVAQRAAKDKNSIADYSATSAKKNQEIGSQQAKANTKLLADQQKIETTLNGLPPFAKETMLKSPDWF